MEGHPEGSGVLPSFCGRFSLGLELITPGPDAASERETFCAKASKGALWPHSFSVFVFSLFL